MSRTLGGTKNAGGRSVTLQPVKYEPTRMLPAMPLDVVFQAWKSPVSMQTDGEEVVFTFGVTTPPAADDHALVVHGVRETFLGLQNPIEARSFFASVGNFRVRMWEIGDGSDPARLTWTDIQNWQEVFRRVMQFGWLQYAHNAHNSLRFDLPKDLLETVEKASLRELLPLGGSPLQVSIRPSRNEGPGGRTELTASIHVISVLDAIVASLYVDTLNGVRYRLCALPDCRKLYEVTSGHERDYCEKAHAHLASVRRRRAEAKQAKTTPTSAAPTTKSTKKRAR